MTPAVEAIQGIDAVLRGMRLFLRVAPSGTGELICVLLRRAVSSQQAVLRWAEKPGVIEKHRGLPSNELVRSPLCVRRV